MKQTHPQPEPRYSPAKVILFALFRPVTAVRRGDHLGLGWTWMVHIVGAGLAAVVLMVLALDGTTIEYVALQWWIFYEDELPPEIPHEVMTWSALATKAIFIEALILIFAVVVMSWCARDEKIRKSYKRALRRLFLLTPHAVTVFALAGGGVFWLDWSEWTFYEWYAYGEMARFLVFFVAGIWSLRVLLAALGCRSGPAMSRWPGRCEGCGYQLTGLTTNKDCPECGLAIVRSLGERIRPGIALPPRMQIGWWLRHTYQAVRRPTALGKKLNILPPDSGHRRCLTATIVLLMLASLIAMEVMHRVVLFAQKNTYGNWPNDWKDIGYDVMYAVIENGGKMALVVTATTVAVVLGGATLIGLIAGWRHGRNMMPAAIRAACYQSGFAVFWAVVFWIGLVILGVVDELGLLDSVVLPYGLRTYRPYGLPYMLVSLWRVCVAVMGITIYLFLVGRTTRAARYANW